jgi:hypothetical protein
MTAAPAVLLLGVVEAIGEEFGAPATDQRLQSASMAGSWLAWLKPARGVLTKPPGL